MGQISNKFDINEEMKGTGEAEKTLPSSFKDNDNELSFKKSLLLSIILHPVAVGIFWVTTFILALLGINFLALDKPPMQPKDIEFVLVTKEAPPINKNTKNRADINSRAGGIHNPKRKVSEPSPAPAPKRASSPTPQRAEQPKQKPTKQPAAQPKAQEAPKAPLRPEPPSPNTPPKPTVPPVARPSASMPKPQMPKLTQNPKSPFGIEVPKNAGPVGNAPSYGTGSATSGGAKQSGGGSTTGGKGTGMPGPRLGSTAGSSSGSGSKGSQGGFGTGNLGNPSPGNPAGAPGVDAIRQPDWGPYMRELERRIKRNWNPPKGDSSKRVVVYFKIAKDGRLISTNIARSSGVPLADQAAKAAIELTAPFSPLPPEYKGSSIDIDFTFDYNVLGASYR